MEYINKRKWWKINIHLINKINENYHFLTYQIYYMAFALSFIHFCKNNDKNIQGGNFGGLKKISN